MTTPVNGSFDLSSLGLGVPAGHQEDRLRPDGLLEPDDDAAQEPRPDQAARQRRVPGSARAVRHRLGPAGPTDEVRRAVDARSSRTRLYRRRRSSVRTRSSRARRRRCTRAASSTAPSTCPPRRAARPSKFATRRTKWSHTSSSARSPRASRASSGTASRTAAHRLRPASTTWSGRISRARSPRPATTLVYAPVDSVVLGKDGFTRRRGRRRRSAVQPSPRDRQLSSRGTGNPISINSFTPRIKPCHLQLL